MQCFNLPEHYGRYILYTAMTGAQNSRLCLFSDLFSGNSVGSSGNSVFQCDVGCFQVCTVQLHEYCINDDIFCSV